MANVILSEEEYNELIKTKESRDKWRGWFYELRYALRKDERLDESIPSTDIPSDVEMIEDLKKRAAESDYYKEKSELLEEGLNAAKRTSDLWKERSYKWEEELKKTNELTDSWKRDYESFRDQFIYPIYNILYPDNPNIDINVTDLLNDIKNLKVYSEENGTMYKEIQEWREKCIARGIDVDRLLSEIKEKDKKISELEARVKYWSNRAVDRCQEVTEVKKDRDEWRKLYSSLSETCADYDKRCKEECEKKYRDEISKLQNIVTEKEVEIRGLKKDNLYLHQNKFFADTAMKKNNKLNQTISDQEVTIKALLITIKEMCKEDETNE